MIFNTLNNACTMPLLKCEKDEKQNSKNRLYNKVVLGIIVCGSLEAQAVIRFKYLLLSQSKIAFGDCNGAMVEEFHQLYKCKFTVLTVHCCVNLPSKGNAERVAREILHLQTVAFLCLFKNYIYSLNGKDRSLLAEEHRCANAGRGNVIIALCYMLP